MAHPYRERADSMKAVSTPQESGDELVLAAVTAVAGVTTVVTDLAAGQTAELFSLGALLIGFSLRCVFETLTLRNSDKPSLTNGPVPRESAV